MPSIERDESRESRNRDRESLVLKHQHSFSESGRASVPMWDSSDPERAPPPLPLNPGTSLGPSTRPNTSARIEEAAALITAKARENAPSGYTTNVMANGSPEKSLVKPHHRRMQSVQNGNVRGLSDSLERRSPDKGLRTPKISDYEARSADRSPTRAGSETPTPTGRATPHHSSKLSVDENTPPSDRMLALHSMRARAESEAPLSNVTNSASGNLGRASHTADALSSQILSLTSIATSLQREMAALSRRSKDNATDLGSLKEATSLRDEDIRNSLKDLVLNLDTKMLIAPEASESTPTRGFYLDNKAHNGTPSRKTFSLPRIPSPNSFNAAAMDRELTASPSIVSSDGAASIALLEKVLREMGTKDGQEAILKTLEKVKATSTQSSVDPLLMTKLEEILHLLKDSSASRALVRSNEPSGYESHGQQNFSQGQLSRTNHDMSTAGCEKMGESSPTPRLVSDELVKILKGVKQSVSEGGGLTNEVKALVRELRGEVLGMGREIARKLEQAESSQQHSVRNDAQGPGREEIGQIVEEGLHELRQNMGELIQENRRQSAASHKSVIDTQEVVLAVRRAFAESQLLDREPARDPAAEREQMLVAVREAWEDCKPEIALEHFGLERDEILDTLKEGLRSYQPQQPDIREVGASYDEVLEAVKRGIADFRPPPMNTEVSLTREEILVSVRECLEGFEFPMPIQPASSMRESDLTRDDVLDAVKEGITNQTPVTKEIEFNRDDLFDAVKAGLEGAPTPMGGVGEQVLEQMHEFLASMKTEFKQYSAANGKDTEQVLDAMKDGFEGLRAEIESYVDRAADVTGKDEIIDTVKDGYRLMQADIEKISVGRGGNLNTPDLLDAMEKEFEHLRESITKSLSRESTSSDREDILDAIRELSDERGESQLSSNSQDIARLVKEELEHMRSTLAGTLVRSTSNLDREEVLEVIREGLEVNQSRSPRKADGSESILSNTSELLDAFQEGVDGIRSDMEKLMNRPVDISTSYEILDTLKAGLENVRGDIDQLHAVQRDLSDTATTKGREVMVHDGNMISTELEGLKVMITQLRIKVEAMDNEPPVPEELHKEDFEELRSSLQGIHAVVHQLRETRAAAADDNVATKEDTDAIETLLRNVKAKMEAFTLPDIDELARTNHLESLEDLLRDTKSVVEESDTRSRNEHASKEDFGIVELLLKEVVTGVEELQDKVKVLSGDESRVTKTDVQVIETLCLDTKTQLDEIATVDFAALPDKNDFETICETMKGFQERVESENELTAQAFEARKIEHGGLANKIDDVKGILGDIRGELIQKLDGSEEGIVELSKVLGHHHESMSEYASAESISELRDMVTRKFEKQLEHHKKSDADTEERDAALLFKHDETQGALSGEISAKIGEKFNELMTKYEDAQLSNEGMLHTLEERDGKHLEALDSTKAVVDDLKLLIDTLGSTTTDACDRISDDSKTVFNQVADANSKLDELQQASAGQYGITRDEIGKTLATAMRLEGSVMEHQPTILAVVKELMAIVSQHYEHSQAHYRQSQTATAEIQSNISAIPSTIPPLLPAPAPLIRDIPAAPQYDDSQLHDKLNALLAHATSAKEALSKVEEIHANSHSPSESSDSVDATRESVTDMQGKLESMHQQILDTASQVSNMVSTQSRLMAEDHESRASEAAEAAIAVEKRMAQKETVEAEIVALSADRSDLTASVRQLKREKDELAGQSKRLVREVAKWETALEIRKQEMREMDLRAEKLERRVLEGVLDHAKAMSLLGPVRMAAGVGGKKRREATVDRDRAMSLKRVPSVASTKTVSDHNNNSHVGKGSKGVTNLGNAVGMALKKRTPLAGTAGNSAANSLLSSRSSGVERRILSTSHVADNSRAPTVMSNRDRALVLAAAPNKGPNRRQSSGLGLVNLKRSHSVKSIPSSINTSTYDEGVRKISWMPNTTSLIEGDGDEANKENEDGNTMVLDEEDANGEVGSEDETTTLTEGRRTSSSASYMYAEEGDSLVYGTASIISYETDNASAVSGGGISSAGGVIGGHGRDEASTPDAAEKWSPKQQEDVEEQDDLDSLDSLDDDMDDKDEQPTEAREADEDQRDKVWRVDKSKQVIALLSPSAAPNEYSAELSTIAESESTISSQSQSVPSTHNQEEDEGDEEEQDSLDDDDDYDDEEQDDTVHYNPDPQPQSIPSAIPEPNPNPNPNPELILHPSSPSQTPTSTTTAESFPPLHPPALFTETKSGNIVLGKNKNNNNNNSRSSSSISNNSNNNINLDVRTAAAAAAHLQYNSDSGLGSEPPTAGIEVDKIVGGGVGGDYFQR